jgi:hypothetical protein
MELTLEMLLSKRDYDNIAFTRKIIELFSSNLTKAAQMLYKFDRDIKWNKVERFPAVDEYVLIRGEVEVRVGDILTLATGQVVVDEENINQYTRPLHYMLHSRILQNGTVEELYQHLSFIEDIAKKLPDAELTELLRSGAVSENVVMENPTLKPILDKITRPTSFEAFDTSNLSEEQFNTLRFCANLGKTGKPH